MKKKKKTNHSKAMRCPYCGAPVVLRSADGIYYDNSRGTMLYVCSRYPECDAYVRVHQGTNVPVGTMANRLSLIHIYCFNRRTKFCKIIHLSGGIELDIFRVSFIGHRVVDEYRQVEEELDEVIELLHRKYGFIDFNVGRNGEFDELATQAVRRFRREWEEWCELTLVEPYPVANLDIIGRCV